MSEFEEQRDVINNSSDNSNKKNNNNIKMLSNQWDYVVDWSINLGNHHFGVTINFPNLSLLNCNDEKINKFYNSINKILYKSFPSITWFIIISEENKNNKIHFHLLIGIRNFIDYNYTLKNNLRQRLDLGITLENNFYCDQNYIDIEVKSLLYFKDIKNWIMYLHKDYAIWRFRGSIYFLYLFNLDILMQYLSNIYYVYLVPNSNMSLEIIDNHLISIYSENNDYKSKLKTIDFIHGIRLIDNELNQGTIIDLLQYYLILNNYYIYNDNIYVKIQKSNISYELVGSIVEVLYNKFQENVVNYFIINYKYYFKGFDFNYLLKTYFIKSKSIIESIKDISTQIIKPDFSLIEFSDGVYSIKYDKFFPNNKNYNFSPKIATIKYYSISYSNTRKVYLIKG